MKQLITLLFCLSLALPGLAQQVQKCCGTSNSTFLLGNANYTRHSQSLYLPSDLTGPVAGDITRVYFRRGTTGIVDGVTLTDLVFRLGQTNQTTFAGGNTFFLNIDTVFNAASATIAPGNAGEWFFFDLDVPFTYVPNQTLILDILYDTSTNNAHGTYGTSNSGRKIYNNDQTATTGSTGSTTWQDFGFDLTMPTGSMELDMMAFNAFPNPLANVVQVFFAHDDHSVERMNVLDIGGREVLSQRVAPGISMVALDLAHIPAGIYMLQVRNRAGVTMIKKLVKE